LNSYTHICEEIVYLSSKFLTIIGYTSGKYLWFCWSSTLEN